MLSTLFLFSVSFISCKEERRKKLKEIHPDNHLVNLTLIRFEKEIHSLQRMSPAELDSFNQFHRNFFELYNNQLLGIGSYKSPAYAERISGFVNDKIISNVLSSVDSVYSDFKQIDELAELFTAYHSYFPKRIVPKIYTYVSGFNYAIAPTDSVLGIGLDYFLGKTRNYYNLLQLPEYQKRKLFPEYLSNVAFQQWIRTDFETDSVYKDLLSQMIYEGKVIYTTDQCMPIQNDTLLLGFTTKQFEWCKQSESAIWRFIIDKKLLYLKNKTDYYRYISDGPFTPGMPRESPARAFCWIGFKIVESYMKNHPKTSLEQLMKINNAQYILTNSKYKPTK